MSQHQDNSKNWVVTDPSGRIVEGPSSKEEASQKKSKLAEQSGQQTEGLKVQQLLTE